VARLVGRKAAAMDDRELRDLERAFIRGGTAAVRARVGTLRQAIEGVARSREILGSARLRAAQMSEPRGPSLVSERIWKKLRTTLDAHIDRVAAYKGVVGWGIGNRWEDGAETDQASVIVYVERKWAPSTLGKRKIPVLPKELEAANGSAVPVDVVELGKLRRYAKGGSALGKKGSIRTGTLGTFALDNETGEFVALTAMHVTGLEADYPPGADMDFTAPPPSTHMGSLLRGTLRGVDAAKISVEPPAEGSFFIKGIGNIRGWRPVSDKGDVGTAVRMFGKESGLVAGRIRQASADLKQFDLDEAIMVDIQSQRGDSGAALVDNRRLVLGLLVGETTGSTKVRLFSPIGQVLNRMECNIPTS